MISKPKLKAMTLEALRKLRDTVSAVIAAKIEKAATAQVRMRKILTGMGYTTRQADLMLASVKGPHSSLRKNVRAKARVKRILHVNPKNPKERWNGRGRPPAWVVAIRSKVNGNASHATH